MLFLKEFCTFSQTLQPQSRESFFKTLHNLGVLPALEITLASENRQTKAASIDILLFIVDFSPTMVREHMLQQLNNTEDVSEGERVPASLAKLSSIQSVVLSFRVSFLAALSMHVLPAVSRIADFAPRSSPAANS